MNTWMCLVCTLNIQSCQVLEVLLETYLASPNGGCADLDHYSDCSRLRAQVNMQSFTYRLYQVGLRGMLWDNLETKVNVNNITNLLPLGRSHELVASRFIMYDF